MVGADIPHDGLLGARYRLEQRIASGGMGSVFLATDERLGRRVAVKTLKEDLADDERFAERFKREARAVAALSHPHIADVFDYGEDDGRPFIVMEYARGRDLARLLREEGPLSPERTAVITSQICEALGHAHAAGVIHRDVKPANVIVDDNDRVKVTDFGIARAAGDSTLTAAGSVLGTAHYISPEQAAGTPVGPASDLYSLGIVVYEMLTGSLPFTGDSPIAVAMRHTTDEVPPPSALNADVPPELDAVVRRATAKVPSERFSDAAQMADELRASVRATAPLAAGAGETAVLAAGGDTAEATHTVWPIPGDRYDPRRVGRAVIAAFLLLGLVAAALFLARAMGGSEPAAQRDPERQPAAPRETAQPTETSEGYIIPETIVGSELKEAEELLKAQGLEVDKTESPSPYEKDIVIGSDPAPGTEVTPGTTVTLVVSTGEEEDDEEPEEDDDHGPPVEPPGKGKGKEKKH